MTESEIIGFLKDTKLCSDFKSCDLKNMAAICRVVNFMAKDPVLCEGDNLERVNHFYIVVKGDVSIAKEHLSEGQMKSLLINILKSGDCFGEIALLQNDKTRTASVKCLTDSTFLTIDKRSFLEFYRSSWQLLHNLNQIFIQYLNHSNNVSRYVVFSSRDASARLMYMIDFLKSKYCAAKDDEFTIDLPFNTSYIAEFLAWKQQMYSRCKLELEKRGLITVETKSITIHSYSKFKAALYD